MDHQWAAFDQLIAVATEGMPHQRQIETAAGLRLPHMGHFVDEQALQRQALPGEIFGPQWAFRVEMDVARRGHDCLPGLERPPFAPDHPDPVIIDRIAEHGARQLNLAGGEGTGAFHPVLHR